MALGNGKQCQITYFVAAFRGKCKMIDERSDALKSIINVLKNETEKNQGKFGDSPTKESTEKNLSRAG